jgi:hypothetical protein
MLIIYVSDGKLTDADILHRTKLAEEIMKLYHDEMEKMKAEFKVCIPQRGHEPC